MQLDYQHVGFHVFRDLMVYGYYIMVYTLPRVFFFGGVGGGVLMTLMDKEPEFMKVFSFFWGQFLAWFLPSDPLSQV